MGQQSERMDGDDLTTGILVTRILDEGHSPS
jgi:hypothetical protein